MSTRAVTASPVEAPPAPCPLAGAATGRLRPTRCGGGGARLCGDFGAFGAFGAWRTAAWAALLLAAAGCAGAVSDAPRAPWEGPLTPQGMAVEKAVDHAFRHTGTAMVAVAYLDLRTGSRVLRRETNQFHAASTMKVPVMIAAWAAVDAGELSIDQPIPVRNEFRSIIDGSRYHLAR